VSDIAYRWGGEEFAILVSTTEKKGISNVAIRVLNAMSNAPIITSADMIKITVSIVCLYHQPNSSLTADELIKRADQAMMDAKAQGRNRIVCRYDDSE
ncbi:MAG: diguanylate cyclase, partial [Gammaproteobacteria bacterium]|nr:diguanylate cyclase [Gammaproteobacteria bacterium]